MLAFLLATLCSCLTPPGAPSNFEIFDFDRETIEKKVSSFDGLVVVDFHAPWCIHCKILDHGMPAIIKRNPDVLFLTVNVDKVRNARRDFRILHIPTVNYYHKNLSELASIVEGSPQEVSAKIDEIKANINKLN